MFIIISISDVYGFFLYQTRATETAGSAYDLLKQRGIVVALAVDAAGVVWTIFCRLSFLFPFSLSGDGQI